MMSPSIQVACETQNISGQSFMGIDGKVWVTWHRRTRKNGPYMPECRVYRYPQSLVQNYLDSGFWKIESSMWFDPGWK